MHLPQAYRSLPRPSSLTKPSHSPTGVFALVSGTPFYCYNIFKPWKLYANISVKPHFFTLSVDYADIVAFPVILYTTVTADYLRYDPSCPHSKQGFIASLHSSRSYKNHLLRSLSHTLYTRLPGPSI